MGTITARDVPEEIIIFLDEYRRAQIPSQSRRVAVIQILHNEMLSWRKSHPIPENVETKISAEAPETFIE